MKFYLKILFFYFLFQSVLSDDKLTLDSVLSNDSTTSLLEDNKTLNVTNLNNTTPVLLNCTNGINNSTDLSKCTPLNITTSFTCTKVNYDFLILSTTWQPKLCYAKNCAKHYNEEPKWRVSGLRGSFANGTRPAQCCSDKQLSVNELNSLMPQLKEDWVYEVDSTVTDSLVEEWNLHGSCVQENEQKTSLQLFSKSLDLKKKLPFQQWLSNAKIQPSNDKKYGLQFFNYTIVSKLNKRFQLRCKTFDYEKRISIVDTINVCVDKSTSEVIDCPEDFESNCLDLVYYPTHLLEYKVPEEIIFKDMNYYRYHNYHSSYSPIYGSSYGYPSTRSVLTGAAIGAAIPAALSLPAAYYFFKNQNKKNKYNNFGSGYPGSYGGTPWYSSTAFSNSFAPPPNYSNKNYNSYGSPQNFGNLGTNHNLYPKQNYFPPAVFSGTQGNKNFGNLNVPDLSPSFYNSKHSGSSYPSYPSYSSGNSYPSYPPKYSSGNSYPSYPSYSSGNSYPSYPPKYSSNPGFTGNYPGMNSGSNVPSYPNYPNTGSLPQAPPPYSSKNSPYPKQPSYDNPPAYSAVDKNKPSYPPYSNTRSSSNNNPYKPSAPSLSELPHDNKQKTGLYPKLPNESSSSNKYSPSAPSYPSSNSKPSSSSSPSKPKSSGGIFGGLFGKLTGSRSKSGGSSYGRSGGSSYGRSGGSRIGGGRSRG